MVLMMKKQKYVLARVFLSFFGIGYAPFFPGTCTTIVSLFFLYNFQSILTPNPLLRAIILLSIFVFCFFLSLFLLHLLGEEGKEDPQWVTMDEFLGTLLACSPLFFMPSNFALWALAFVLFRFFDTFKPIGIGQIDSQHTAISVLMDDVLGGVYSVIVFFIIINLNLFFSF